jgi:hypothetical protein
VEGGVVKGETLAIDDTFIEACSKRDPYDDRRSYSDPNAMMSKHDRSYNLGHRTHIAADACSDLPVVYIAVPAYEN